MTSGTRALALLAFCLGLQARAEVLSHGPTGFLIENAATVPADPATTWNALVNDVGRWWPADHTWFGRSENLRIDARAGGCFCEIDGERQAQHMTISFVDPGRLLRMLGGLGPLQGMGVHGALDWRLEAADGGTRITLRYQVSGYAPGELDALVPVVDQVQAQQLGGLAKYLTP
jgi:uncharacterized protein YndB with AHSA1/START domain